DTNGAAGPEFTDTRGNNVDAHLDRDDDDVADATPGRPSGGTALDFSGYAFNPAASPTTLQNQNAAQANLYYVVNTLHDVHYMYGFTEAAGNFQVNNYGHGGVGNDPVQADAQDGGGTNNANFGTPADGQSGRMQMYLWTSTTPSRDGDFDNDVIIHEFGHGVSNRLTGGPANSSALDAQQSGGMGEGWSDFYALMFQQRATDTQNAGYGMATYVVGQSQTGQGLRRKRYSFDMSIDPLTWDAYGTGGSGGGVTRSTEVHNTGEIWTTTLWDMNWLLINKYGFDADLATGWSPDPGPAHAGNKLALRLVMDAMKLQPANPSFTQARDAIVAADAALNGGNDLYEIWSAFARRGLGQGSSSGTSGSTSTPTLSFTLPMLVQAVTPTTGAVAPGDPLSYTVTTTAAIDPATLDPADLVVNGQPATNVSYTAGATSATFTFDVDPVTAEGPQTIQVAAGAFNRASDAGAVSAFASTFYVDATPLTVTSITPAAGATVPPPLTTVDVNLSGAIDPASVQTTDLSISRGTVTGFTLLNDNTTVRFTVANLTSELPFTVAVAAGAFLDPEGNPSAAFAGGTVTLDYVTTPFPTPLQPQAPLGSLAYGGSFAATVGAGGDNDSFTLNLAAGQTLNVTVTPDATLQPKITVSGPGTNVTASAAAAGVAAQLNLIPVTAAGTYTLTVSGVASTTGRYTLQPTLNVTQEAESNGGATNDTPATAQNLGPSLLTPGGGLATATVHGRSDPAGLISEAEPNGTTATATTAGTYAAAATGSLYQIALTGSLGSSGDLDYFNIGPMQAGDVLTVTLSGSPSGRGAASDGLVRLYRSGATANVIQDDDSGPGFDSLIYRFTITTSDNYYIRAASANSSAAVGAYQIAALLENTGAAPATGGTATAEVEANDTKGTATNVANAWRPVAYTATAAGTITSGDTDLYSYQFTAGDVVTLVARSASGLAPQAALLNAAGAVIASEDGTSTVAGAGGLSPIYGYVIPTTGTYYFRVTAASGTTGGYTAEVTLSTPATLPTAPFGQDLYSFPLAAGQVASAVVKATPAGALHIAILDPTGAVMATGVTGATNVDEAVSNVIAAAAGTYYLRVSGPANVDYQATVVTGGAFDVEPNGSFAAAQPILAETAVLGAVSGSDDWYRITLSAGDTLTLTTATPGGTAGQSFTNTFDPAIEVYDPSGALIGGDDNSAADGRNATLTGTAAVAGNYRVRVLGAGGTAGEYVLSAAVVPVPVPATVQTVTVDDGSAQRSVVRSLTVTFSGPVTFALGGATAAFQLTRTGPTGPTGTVALAAVVATDGQGRTVVTLTFPPGAFTESNTAAGAVPSLIDGTYTLTVLSSAITGANGLPLDGNGDGIAGGDYALSTHRLFGDVDGDGDVDLLDLNPLVPALFGVQGQAGPPVYNPAFDFEGDGDVDLLDLNQFVQRLFTSGYTP
ncbi:MAG TPA: M36 family metallopeptidase, partial [Gemmataceae bacterium]